MTYVKIDSLSLKEWIYLLCEELAFGDDFPSISLLFVDLIRLFDSSGVVDGLCEDSLGEDDSDTCWTSIGNS